MPAQHYQALRLILPDHPILRLARHRSYHVKRLWAGSMPNSFQDAFLKADVPVDAVRVHPQILRLYADLARRLWPVSAERERLPRRLLLQRNSRWRQLLNADALIAAMARRGFEVRDPARMSFADQIRAIANADAIAGQSAAYFANIAFARPGAEVFALFSNAPGTNFNLWPVLGAPLGVRVVNVVGWRIPRSTGGAAPEAHEHFTVPPHLLTSFFPLAESNLQDVATIVAQAHRNREPFIHSAVYIELSAHDLDQLKLLQTEVMTELIRSKLNVDRLMLRQQQGFQCVMPSGFNVFRDQFERVLPASSVANLYPFNYSGKTDANGFYIGRDKFGSNVLIGSAGMPPGKLCKRSRLASC